MRCVALCIALLAGALAWAPPPARAAEPGTRLKPIIAELFAAPAAFADKPIEIYGLVIGSDHTHMRFQLQDVSQHPLTIVGNARLRAKIGDQLIVRGILRRRGKDIYFVASSLIATRVLGGGGCC
jgi:hypothetical protein